MKCAPFILGTTIRGAILDYLIRTLCNDEKIRKLEAMKDPQSIAHFHRECGQPCAVKLFFSENPIVWFSFGEFETPEYQTVTRIGVARETRSAAEGSIFNMETIAPGSEFKFSIILFEEAAKLQSLLIETAGQIGDVISLGRSRSIGFGRFEVTKWQPEEFEDSLTQAIAKLPQCSGRLNLSFKTPFVLPDSTSLHEDELGEYVMKQICHVASLVSGKGNLQPMKVEHVESIIHPDFVGRFSYERGLRENRLVAWSNSKIRFSLTSEADHEQFAIASILGIGPWNDCGFGQFELSE